MQARAQISLIPARHAALALTPRMATHQQATHDFLDALTALPSGTMAIPAAARQSSQAGRPVAPQGPDRFDRNTSGAETPSPAPPSQPCPVALPVPVSLPPPQPAVAMGPARLAGDRQTTTEDPTTPALRADPAPCAAVADRARAVPSGAGKAPGVTPPSIDGETSDDAAAAPVGGAGAPAQAPAPEGVSVPAARGETSPAAVAASPAVAAAHPAAQPAIPPMAVPQHGITAAPRLPSGQADPATDAAPAPDPQSAGTRSRAAAVQPETVPPSPARDSAVTSSAASSGAGAAPPRQEDAALRPARRGAALVQGLSVLAGPERKAAAAHEGTGTQAGMSLGLGMSMGVDAGTLTAPGVVPGADGISGAGAAPAAIQQPPAAAPTGAGLAEAEPAGTLSPQLQIARAARDAQPAAAGNPIVVRLHPETLGAVQFRLTRTKEGGAQLTLQVDKPATLRLLQSDIAHLHQALDSAGLSPAARHVTLELSPGTANAPAAVGGNAPGPAGGGAGPGQGQGHAGGQDRRAWQAQPGAPPVDAEATPDEGAPQAARGAVNITA